MAGSSGPALDNWSNLVQSLTSLHLVVFAGSGRAGGNRSAAPWVLTR